MNVKSVFPRGNRRVDLTEVESTLLHNIFLFVYYSWDGAQVWEEESEYSSTWVSCEQASVFLDTMPRSKRRSERLGEEMR